MLKDVLEALAQRAAVDEVFRREWEADPEAVLERETGLSLDELRGQAAAMDEDELDAVAGGIFGRLSMCRLCGHRHAWTQPCPPGKMIRS